jgi:hypothetical protein
MSHTKLLCNINIREALDRSYDTGVGWELLDSRAMITIKRSRRSVNVGRRKYTVT